MVCQHFLSSDSAIQEASCALSVNGFKLFATSLVIKPTATNTQAFFQLMRLLVQKRGNILKPFDLMRSAGVIVNTPETNTLVSLFIYRKFIL